MNFEPLPRAVPVQSTNKNGPYTGADWASSMLRPGCQDHLLHPSRSGDARVFHRGHATTLQPMRSSK